MKFQKRDESKGSGTGSKLFLKVESGDHVVGLLRGEISTYYQKYEDGKYSVVAKGTKGATERFSVNIIVNGEDGKPVAKIFQFGVGLSNEFYRLQEDYGDLERIFIKIRREGEKKNTKWYVSVPKDQPSERQLEGLMAIPLNILDREETGPSLKPNTLFVEEEIGTITYDDAQNRIAELKGKASKGYEKFPGDDGSDEDSLPF